MVKTDLTLMVGKHMRVTLFTPPIILMELSKWVLQKMKDRHPMISCSGRLNQSKGVNAFQDTAIFQDYHGLPEFRNAIARFMKKVRGDRGEFDPDRVVMSGGATGAHELMAFCLADPGDAFLVPTPYYPG